MNKQCVESIWGLNFLLSLVVDVVTVVIDSCNSHLSKGV